MPALCLLSRLRGLPGLLFRGLLGSRLIGLCLSRLSGPRLLRLLRPRWLGGMCLTRLRLSRLGGPRLFRLCLLGWLGGPSLRLLFSGLRGPRLFRLWCLPGGLRGALLGLLASRLCMLRWLCVRLGCLCVRLRRGLSLFFALVLRVCGDHRPKEQKQGCGTSCSKKLHSDRLHQSRCSDMHAEHQSR
jgi:hypothetical protein